jgi:hypothetical protein
VHVTSRDPRIRREQIHNQDVLLPTIEAWRQILREGQLDGMPVPIPEMLSGWLDAYAQFEVASLGLVRWPGRWQPLPLLRLGGRCYRVHFENVICEHCDRQCGPSACPDSAQYAGTGYSPQQVSAEYSELPVQHCPHCQGLLRRRQTLWLASQSSIPGTAASRIGR